MAALSRLEGIRVVEADNIPETLQVRTTLERMAEHGVDFVTCHVDSPKVVIETAERLGIYSSGYHVDQSALAPNGYLTGAEWNWEKVYRVRAPCMR